MNVFRDLYIDGAWVPSSGDGTIDVVNAATEEVMARIPEGTVDDVDHAVGAARRAFEEWSATPVAERAKQLRRIAEGIAARAEELAEVITGEVGMPLHISRRMQVQSALTVLGMYPDLVEGYAFEERVGDTLVVREPIGVVGCITPWNYPLHQIVAKMAPALAAGCTVVVKPSEVAPIAAFVVAEVVHEVGLPAGVFNLVTGYGPTVGEALVAHPEVDMISFTGSTQAGRRVGQVAAQTVKKVALELGGKSANVVLDDADLERAVRAGVSNAYNNAGQTCTAWTRMLVPRARHAEAVELARAAVEQLVVGDPYDEGTDIGPLASAAQRDRVRAYITAGIEEGATLVTGGAAPLDALGRGYFVRPTVFADVTTSMTIAQEEIFGPVLSILPYEDDDDAVRIANDTIYGLAGGVWSSDPTRALAVARRMRTGRVDLNGRPFNLNAPFGGYKQSGLGRELGRYGLEECLEHKSIQV